MHYTSRAPDVTAGSSKRREKPGNTGQKFQATLPEAPYSFHLAFLIQRRGDTNLRSVHKRQLTFTGVKTMRKSLAFIVLAASLVGAGEGTVCFAAVDAKPKAASSPVATLQQSQQKKTPQPSQRKMHRMQKTGGGSPSQGNSAAEEVAPNPSQRSMRQKLKAAKPVQVPATVNPEAEP
jgi:hypothetical protein